MSYSLHQKAVKVGPFKPPKPQAGGGGTVANAKESGKVLNSFYDFGSRAPKGLLKNVPNQGLSPDRENKMLMGSDKYFKISDINLPPKVINEMAREQMVQKQAHDEMVSRHLAAMKKAEAEKRTMQRLQH